MGLLRRGGGPRNMAVLFGGAFAYSVDFTALADGDLPSDLQGDTWAISSGAAVNTPTLGGDVTPDKGLEGTYTDGLNYRLTSVGSPTVAESADAHSGSKAQQFTATAQYDRLRPTSLSTEAGKWYRITAWLKRTAGSGGGVTMQFNPDNEIGYVRAGAAVESATYAQKMLSLPHITLNTWRNVIEGGTANFDTVILDDRFCGPITQAELCATLRAEATGRVGADWTIQQGNMAGVVINLDDPANPQNYVALVHTGEDGTVNNPLALLKCVAGTLSVVWCDSIAYSAGATIEIRKTNTSTYQMFYDDVQRGSDQTITDASVVGNVYAGMLSAYEGNSADTFFFASDMNRNYAQVAYLGGSITNGSAASNYEATSWRAKAGEWISKNHTSRVWQHINAGVGSTTSWYGLIRLADDVIAHAPEVVFVDFAVNDVETVDGGDYYLCGEALIRRLRTALPNAKILVWVFTWPNDYSHIDADRRVVRDAWVAIANNYNCTLLRWDTYLESLMPDPYADGDVEVYLAGVANVHPDDDGHDAAYDLAIPELADLSDNNSGELPDRVYADSADFERDPIARFGTDNDGETGVWTTVGTARQSSEVGASIQWTGTFGSFSLYFDDSAGAELRWNLDGGAWNGKTVEQRDAIAMFASGEHTITVEVVSGTVVIETFVAI